MVERHPASSSVSLTPVEIYQATGMICVQLNTNYDTALHRLISHAVRTRRTVVDVSQDIVNRQLDLGRAGY